MKGVFCELKAVAGGVVDRDARLLHGTDVFLIVENAGNSCFFPFLFLDNPEQHRSVTTSSGGNNPGNCAAIPDGVNDEFPTGGMHFFCAELVFCAKGLYGEQ